MDIYLQKRQRQLHGKELMLISLVLNGWITSILALNITFAAQSLQFVGVTRTGAAHFVTALLLTQVAHLHREVQCFFDSECSYQGLT